MPAQNTNLFLLQDLEDSSRTRSLADSDLYALRTVADWVRVFVSQPNKELGRTGPVCPFVPPAEDRKILWLAPERIATRSVAEIVETMNAYKTLLLRAEPVEGDATSYKAIVVVFTDLSADRAKEYMDAAEMQHLKTRSYVEDGVVLGEFHPRNEGSAIRNASFHPFKSPVPFLLMRHAVLSDWMFFLDSEKWLSFWARRFGASAVRALADALRRTNWRGLEARPVQLAESSKTLEKMS